MKWAIAILGVVAAAGCGIVGDLGPQTIGSGVSKTDARKVTSFETVVSKGSPDVEITVGKEPSVEVIADDNIVPLITTEVSGSTLIIGSKGSYSSKNGVRIKVVTTSLKELEINGSGNARVTGVSGGDFLAKVNGSGDVTVEGTADKIDATCNGSGNIDLSDLKAKSADVSIHGSGNIDVNVSDNLDASIFGSGNVSYVGDPKVNKNVNGSGEVRATKG